MGVSIWVRGHFDCLTGADLGIYRQQSVNSELDESFYRATVTDGRACTDTVVPERKVADRPTVGDSVTRVSAAVS